MNNGISYYFMSVKNNELLLLLKKSCLNVSIFILAYKKLLFEMNCEKLSGTRISNWHYEIFIPRDVKKIYK